MKKTVTVNVVRKQVEVEFIVTDKILGHIKTKRYDKNDGWLPVEDLYLEAIIVIDGVEYPSIKYWYTRGRGYKAEFFCNGHFYSSTKKLIERILELANSGEGNLPA